MTLSYFNCDGTCVQHNVRACCNVTYGTIFHILSMRNVTCASHKALCILFQFYFQKEKNIPKTCASWITLFRMHNQPPPPPLPFRCPDANVHVHTWICIYSVRMCVCMCVRACVCACAIERECASVCKSACACASALACACMLVCVCVCLCVCLRVCVRFMRKLVIDSNIPRKHPPLRRSVK